MAALWLRMPLVLSFLLLAGSTPLAQTQFASLTGRITSTGGNPLPDAEVVATNVATGVSQSAKSNQEASTPCPRCPLAPTSTCDSGKVSIVRDHPYSARVGPERAHRDQTANGVRRHNRGHRHHTDPADAGCGRRRGPLGGDDPAHAPERAQLLPTVVAAARRLQPDPNSFTQPKNLDFRDGRTSTGSVNRKTTTCSTAWT